MAQVGFSGEVHKASCACHQGKFFVAVFCIRPGIDRTPCGFVMFDSEAEAEKNMESVVRQRASEVIDEMGLSIDQAKSITVTHGEAAVQAEQRVHNEANPYLH